MFASIGALTIQENFLKNTTDYFRDPLSIVEMWKKEGGPIPEGVKVGDIIFNSQKSVNGLKEPFPQALMEAIRDSKRPFKRQVLHGGEIFTITIAGGPNKNAGTLSIFEWGAFYKTGSGYGLWMIEWGSPTIRFLGRRRSFESGANAVFCYYAEDIESVILLMTSDKDIPLTVREVKIVPKETMVVKGNRTEQAEREKKEFCKTGGGLRSEMLERLISTD